jgi:hypothetical protein
VLFLQRSFFEDIHLVMCYAARTSVSDIDHSDSRCIEDVNFITDTFAGKFFTHFNQATVGRYEFGLTASLLSMIDL